MNELEWPKNIIQGKSTAPFLNAYSSFNLVNHPQKNLNSSYYVYRLIHRLTRLPVYNNSENHKIYSDHFEGRTHFSNDPESSSSSLTLYDNEFYALPRHVSYCPPRLTQKPKIAGNQTAIVVGPLGEEVYCDYLGRIKIQFHWDTRGKFDINSSCWVRVSQNWAGNNWGGLVIPRVGMEVVVTFINGDPDNPLVVGCVYNGANNPPNSVVHNPTKVTFQTAKAHNNVVNNEISIDDNAGKELVCVNAAKNMNINIGENYNLKLNNGNISTLITHGNVNTSLENGNKTLNLSSGNYTIQVQNGNIIIHSTGDISINTEGSLNLSGMNVNIRAQNSVSIDALTKVDVKAGGIVSVDFPGKTPTFPM